MADGQIEIVLPSGKRASIDARNFEVANARSLKATGKPIQRASKPNAAASVGALAAERFEAKNPDIAPTWFQKLGADVDEAVAGYHAASEANDVEQADAAWEGEQKADEIRRGLNAASDAAAASDNPIARAQQVRVPEWLSSALGSVGGQLAHSLPQAPGVAADVVTGTLKSATNTLAHPVDTFNDRPLEFVSNAMAVAPFIKPLVGLPRVARASTAAFKASAAGGRVAPSMTAHVPAVLGGMAGEVARDVPIIGPRLARAVREPVPVAPPAPRPAQPSVVQRVVNSPLVDKLDSALQSPGARAAGWASQKAMAIPRVGVAAAKALRNRTPGVILPESVAAELLPTPTVPEPLDAAARLRAVEAMEAAAPEGTTVDLDVARGIDLPEPGVPAALSEAERLAAVRDVEAVAPPGSTIDLEGQARRQAGAYQAADDILRDLNGEPAPPPPVDVAFDVDVIGPDARIPGEAPQVARIRAYDAPEAATRMRGLDALEGRRAPRALPPARAPAAPSAAQVEAFLASNPTPAELEAFLGGPVAQRVPVAAAPAGLPARPTRPALGPRPAPYEELPEWMTTALGEADDVPMIRGEPAPPRMPPAPPGGGGPPPEMPRDWVGRAPGDLDAPDFPWTRNAMSSGHWDPKAHWPTVDGLATARPLSRSATDAMDSALSRYYGDDWTPPHTKGSANRSFDRVRQGDQLPTGPATVEELAELQRQIRAGAYEDDGFGWRNARTDRPPAPTTPVPPTAARPPPRPVRPVQPARLTPAQERAGMLAGLDAQIRHILEHGELAPPTPVWTAKPIKVEAPPKRLPAPAEAPPSTRRTRMAAEREAEIARVEQMKAEATARAAAPDEGPIPVEDAWTSGRPMSEDVRYGPHVSGEAETIARGGLNQRSSMGAFGDTPMTSVEVPAAQEARIGAVQLVDPRRPGAFAVIHRATKPGQKTWQISRFDEAGAVGDTSRATLEEAINVARRDGYSVSEVARLDKPGGSTAPLKPLLAPKAPPPVEPVPPTAATPAAEPAAKTARKPRARKPVAETLGVEPAPAPVVEAAPPVDPSTVQDLVTAAAEIRRLAREKGLKGEMLAEAKRWADQLDAASDITDPAERAAFLARGPGDDVTAVAKQRVKAKRERPATKPAKAPTRVQDRSMMATLWRRMDTVREQIREAKRGTSDVSDATRKAAWERVRELEAEDEALRARVREIDARLSGDKK